MSSRRASRPRGPGGLILVVSGPAGAGKTTLCERLVEANRGRMVLSVSWTTRRPRRGEVHGQHYFFVSKARFRKDLEAGKFAEHAQVAGEIYGTPRAFLERSLRAHRDVVLDIDVQGCAKVRRSPRFQGRVVTVFVLPLNHRVLEGRLRNRKTDDEQRIRRRLDLAEHEIKRAGEYDYLVINDRLAAAVADLAAICRAEQASLRRRGSRAWAVLKKEWRLPAGR